MRKGHPARRRRRGRERGSALVESAIVAPAFFVLAFGIIEMGLLYRDYLTATSAVADASRVGSIIGPDVIAGSGGPITADFEIMKAMRDGLAGLDPDSIERIVVFRSFGTATGDAVDQVPDACRAGVALPGRCNVYDPSEAFLRVLTDDVDWFNCALTPASPACDWDPVSRDDGPNPTDVEYLGVYVSIDRNAYTGFFQDRYRIREAAVIRLEPGQTE